MDGSDHRIRNRRIERAILRHMGARLRERRQALGFSAADMAKRIGVSTMTLDRLEKGSTRLGAARLLELSKVLDISVDFLFEEMPMDMISPLSAIAEHVDRDGGRGGWDLHDDRNIEEEGGEEMGARALVANYWRISDPTVRRRLYEVIKSVSRETARWTKNHSNKPSVKPMKAMDDDRQNTSPVRVRQKGRPQR